MKIALVKLLFSNKGLSDTCVGLIADEQFIRIHHSMKIWGKFSNWLLLVSGAIVVFIVSNFDSLREVVFYDEFLFTLLKWSVFCGFAAKIFDFIGDFFFARMNLLGLDSIKRVREFIEEVGQFEDDDLDTNCTKNALLQEFHRRMPFFFRIDPPEKMAATEYDNYFQYRAIVTLGFLTVIFCLAQLITFAIGIGIQLDILQEHINSIKE